ncbi:uncharacterized protein PgNI_03581 [Pyricularia grisea]|uniref:C2H2-type domain-containing protein n=1 Tax=Pyricularia grisea TaxID=148305 RepID=A0A6P8B8D4_PYRGI|nr:uncharacterized protein PgNI_03581 [Pyricularia grisea]TLD12129.1 hypothetical protein PgNI_03581 [Pyricularia grisea]
MYLVQPFHIWVLFATSAIALPSQINHPAGYTRGIDALNTNPERHQNTINPDSINAIQASTEGRTYPLHHPEVIKLLTDPTLRSTKHYYCPHCHDGPKSTREEVYDHIETHDPPLNTHTYIKGKDTKITFEKIKE